MIHKGPYKQFKIDSRLKAYGAGGRNKELFQKWTKELKEIKADISELRQRH